MCWYKDKKDEDSIIEKISLVAESELSPKFSSVKIDFQKLLVANAELRLLIFTAKSQKQLERLKSHFDKAISNYQLLEKGSAFLFACFLHDKKELLYCEKYKS